MSEHNDPKTIQENILKAIEAGKVHMRPRWHFVLQAVLYVLGGILIVLASIFVGSFILFMLHQNGAWFAMAFGGPGIKELFTTLPILLILFAIVFIIVLPILVRRSAVAYGKPTLYTVVGIIILVGAGSLLVERSHIHNGLYQQAQDDNLPVAGRFYIQFGAAPANNTTPGRIIKILDHSFFIKDPNGQVFEVMINHQTRLPYGSDFDVNDKVVVLGTRNGNVIVATGVREFEPDERMFRQDNDNDVDDRP